MDHLCYFRMSCVCPAFASVHCCLVVTCWERQTSSLSFVMFNCVLSLSHLVSFVRCGTFLHRFLIFATFLTFTIMLCPLQQNKGNFETRGYN